MMLNTVPMMMYLTFFIMLTVSMMFMMTNNMFMIEWELLSVMSMSIKLDLMLEWSNTMYSSTIMLISASVLKFSKNYMKADLNKARFTCNILLFIVSMNMLILIPNMVCLLIGWDGLGITSFILIIHYNNPRSLSAGMLTMLMNRLGDTFILMSIVTTLNTGDWFIINYPIKHGLSTIQWFGIMTACMTKSAQMPYSSWLPAAMAAPTPVSALVHSSTLVTAGIFLLYRFNNMTYSSPLMQTILTAAGVSTMLIAGISAIYENDMKKIIALSTLSQLGLMTTCLGMNLPDLAFFHMSAHAMFKSLLFISAGCMISVNSHNQDLRTYGQFSNMSPMTSSSMLIASTALIGVPFMSGYYSKHAIMEWSNTLSINLLMYMMIMLAIFMTSYYSVRVITLLLMTTPTFQSTMFSHYSSNNNNFPLMIMCTMSILSSSMMQWLSPLIMMNTTVTENTKYLLSTSLIILSMITIFSKMTSVPPYKNNKAHKKFLSTLSFMAPMSTQCSLPVWMFMSMSLYKQLDQTWLEKSTSLGPTKIIMKSSTHLNLSMSSYSQKSLMMSATSMLIITCMHFIIM